MSAPNAMASPTMRRTPSASRAVSQENNAPIGQDHSTVTSKKTVVAAFTASKSASTAPKKIKLNHETSFPKETSPMDKLLAKLSEQQAILNKQHDAMKTTEDITYSRTFDYVATAGSSKPATPAPEVCHDGTAATLHASVVNGEQQITGAEDLHRLRAELDAAKSKIALMDRELAQSRITKHTMDQAIGNNSDTDFQLPLENPTSLEEHTNMQSSLGPAYRPGLMRNHSWQTQDDARSDTSEALSAGGFNRARAIWNNKPAFGSFPAPSFQQTPEPLPSSSWLGRPFGQSVVDATMPYSAPPQITTFRAALGPERVMSESDFLMAPPPGRRGGSRFNNRSQSSFPYASSASSYDGYTPPSSGLGHMGSAPSSMSNNMCPPPGYGNPMGPGMGGGMFEGFPPPIGTPLSPHAPEFTSVGPGWKNEAIATEGQTYLPTTEPLNYRRLLDRTVNCNWKYIVDKIVCNNDQQASIFLQQKLKVGTPEQKYDIVEAIVAQAYPLMVNRFGNFLVQRCFEHGTPEQVIKIAESIRGNTLNLSMDAFGCHVVQKAFDSVPEDYKAIMVHELLRRIPETVIHRYACHVWQKLFELRWTESPPQIMQYVNEALHGMWHEVALGETGSLVVQNIFENCLEEDKRPCIEEVLASIDIVAHGQFGNWCIQHICEHGAPADRSRAIDHVIRYASEYSMDQFASKVVEKCLKIGGVDFLSRYLDRVCEGRLDRPRIPLIDIASDQYGNYLIQYILTHSNPQHREIVAQHIRKHMVSLRGSKFGSRVGMLCTNPAIQTRPGPGAGPLMGAPSPRIGPQPTPRYSGAYR